MHSKKRIKVQILDKEIAEKAFGYYDVLKVRSIIRPIQWFILLKCETHFEKIKPTIVVVDERIKEYMIAYVWFAFKFIYFIKF